MFKELLCKREATGTYNLTATNIRPIPRTPIALTAVPTHRPAFPGHALQIKPTLLFLVSRHTREIARVQYQPANLRTSNIVTQSVNTPGLSFRNNVFAYIIIYKWPFSKNLVGIGTCFALKYSPKFFASVSSLLPEL